MEITEGMVVALPPGAEMGKYKLLKQLAQGGFGLTYIGWDKKLRRQVVLKECFPVGLCVRHPETLEIIPSSPAHEEMYKRCLIGMHEEAVTLAALNHDRIVRVYDVFKSNGSLFLVMPYYEGGTLRERMDAAASGGPAITPEQMERWLRLLLQGLQYMHSKGIVHRDIKPGNIMFDENDLPVIIDFGAALNRPELTGTTTQGAFSRLYAAPEQLTGKGEVGPWTDLFSLAATWYELMSGGLRAEPADSRLMQDDLTPLPRLPGVDDTVAESVVRNLALKPQDRCPDADTWLRWMANHEPPACMVRRRGWKRVGLISLIVMLPIAGALAWQQWGMPAQAAPVAQPSGAPAAPFDRDALAYRIREFFKVPQWEEYVQEFIARTEQEHELRMAEIETWGKAWQKKVEECPPDAERCGALQREFEAEFRAKCDKSMNAMSAANDTFFKVKESYAFDERRLAREYPAVEGQQEAVAVICYAIKEDFERDVAKGQSHTTLYMSENAALQGVFNTVLSGISEKREQAYQQESESYAEDL